MSRNILTDSASWQPVAEDMDRGTGQVGPAEADGSEPAQVPENRTQEDSQSAPASPAVAGQTSVGAKRIHGAADEM